MCVQCDREVEVVRLLCVQCDREVEVVRLCVSNVTGRWR